MTSPETPTTTTENAEAIRQTQDLGLLILNIELEQEDLKQALADNDFEKQKSLILTLKNSLSRAKKIQALLEGKIENPEAILKIDRSVDVLSSVGWEDGLEIVDKDTDTRSTALTEIDLSKLKLDTSWLGGKSSMLGEERLEALKTSGNVRLDAQILITLKNLPKEELNKKMEIIAESNGVSLGDLKKKVIFFDGTFIKNPDGNRYALCLGWDGSGWDWRNDDLGNDWGAGSPSLVLAS